MQAMPLTMTSRPSANPFLNTLCLHVAVAAGLIAASVLSAATVKLNGHNFTLPDGFEIELIAAAPLVNRPISIAFDERGRLYATDSAGMSDKAEKQLETKPHRIVRLEDTDGDGRFDKSVVFADKMMFPEGAMFYEGSLYVAAPPQIWKLTDTDNDGVADKREVWFDGKTLTGCANDLHGPFLGRDGWIYWAKGAFAQQNYTLPNGKPFTTRASHLFRARPDGTGIEPVMTGGMDNPVDIAFSAAGERFFSTTFFQNPAGGKRDGLIHAIYGGVYGKQHDVLSGHVRTGELMPVLAHMGAAAPCGLTTYDSRVMGEEWRGNLLACYFNLRKVVRHQLVPDGATFKTKDSDLLASDHVDFHPTDVIEDADGSVIIVDTGGWYKICCPTSQLAKPDVLGGIYRIRKKGAARLPDARGLKIDWAKLLPTDLVGLLNDDRLFVQQRAIHELGKRGAPAVPALNAALENDWPERQQINAIWALTRIPGEAARQPARMAVRFKNANVRHAAIHSAGLWRDGGAVEALVPALGRDAGATSRAAAEALGRIGDVQAVQGLLSAAQRLPQQPQSDARRILEHSLIYALIEMNDPAAVRAELDRVLPAARRESVIKLTGEFDVTAASLWCAALMALDQMNGGGLKPEEVVPLLNSAHPSLRRTAAWIVAHRPEWGDALTGYFQQRLSSGPADAESRAELESQLARLAAAPAVQELLAASLRDERVADPSRLLVLRAMAAAEIKEMPARWQVELAQLLAQSKHELLRQTVATVRALPQPKQGHAELTAALLKVGRGKAPAQVRLDALAAAPALDNVEAALFQFLTLNLVGEQPMLTRAAAASVLAKAKLAPEQQMALATRMKTVGALEAPRLLPAFERGTTEALGMALVSALKDSPGLRGLRVDLIQPLLAKYPQSVRDAGAPLIQLLNTDAAAQTARLEELLAQTKGGDVRRGQVVFLSAKAACSACHAQGYLGGRLGPDLTNLGKVRTERDLLESIIFPSASFVRSYESFMVITKSGEDITGIIRKDAPEEVVLATGPETEVRIPRAQIIGMRPGAVSVMPAGMDSVLTRQELADLLAFLKAPR